MPCLQLAMVTHGRPPFSPTCPHLRGATGRHALSEVSLSCLMAYTFYFLFFAMVTWSRPVTPMNLSPGHTPKMVPTVKLVSTMEEPSRGSKATTNPSPANIDKLEDVLLHSCYHQTTYDMGLQSDPKVEELSKRATGHTEPLTCSHTQARGMDTNPHTC